MTIARHLMPGKHQMMRQSAPDDGFDGRPSVLDENGIDKLLFMLKVVHGEPRYDLYHECALKPRPPAALSASAATPSLVVL